MDKEKPRSDFFEEVERKYAYLKEQNSAGNLTDKEFAKQLERLMFQDQKGRWWSKSRKSGEWHFFDGKKWVKGTPPGLEETPGVSQEATQKKPVEAKFKETKQPADAGLKAPQQQAADVGVLARPPDAEEEQRQAGKAQQEKATSPTPPKGTKRRLSRRGGLLVSWLLMGLGVIVLAVGAVLGVRSTAPESSAPPAPPPSPSSSLLFKDDFSSTASGWPRNKDNYGGSGDYDASSGIYAIAPAAGKLHYATISNAGNIEDANVEVDATRSEATPKTAYWGVVCRQSLNSNNDASGYSLAIQNDGVPAIWKVKDGVPTLISDPKTSTKVKDPSATNHIRGDCVGDTLTLYVNDQKLAEASDQEFASGECGLYAASPDGSGTNVSFDNFSVSKP